MRKRLILVIFLTLVITILMVGLIYFLTSKQRQKGRTSQGFYYEKWKASDISPQFPFINKAGSEFSYYDFTDKKLKVYSSKSNKIEWKSQSLTHQITDIKWSPVAKGAFIAYDEQSVDNNEMITRYRYIKPDGQPSNPLADNILDIGWWDSESIYSLRLNTLEGKSDLILLNANTGKEKMVLFTINDYLSKIFISSNHKYYAGLKIGQGNEKDKLYIVELNQKRLIGQKDWLSGLNDIIFSENGNYYLSLFEGDELEITGKVYETQTEIEQPLNIKTTRGSVAWHNDKYILNAQVYIIGDGLEEGDKLERINIANPKDKLLILIPKERLSIQAIRSVNKENIAFFSNGYLYRVKLK